MVGEVLSTYVNRVIEVRNTGFNSQLLMDLVFQGISMVILTLLKLLENNLAESFAIIDGDDVGRIIPLE